MATTTTATTDVGLPELQQRLVTFTEQLESIHQLLQLEPTNAEYLNIAQDLVEVIRLTKEMIDLKLASGGGSATPTTATSSTQARAPRPEAAPPVVAQHDDTTDAEGLPALGFAPGTACEAESKGTWFPAYIESMTARGTYHVRYLGFGNTDELPTSSLRAIDLGAAASASTAAKTGALPPRREIDVGFRCQAKYYVDAQLYPATVTATTAHGFQVTFDGYGNTEEVPYEYLCPLPPSTDSAVGASATGAAVVSVPTGTMSSSSVETTTPTTATRAAASTVAGLKPREAVISKPIKVPEHLQVLPTDTEAEKERKRKRLKAIQKLNKVKEVENERNLKQHDWKAFQHKALKKGVRGSGVLSKRGTSMFASPDSVQGRVGVVGSGQGMTHFEDTRKKLKPSQLDKGAPGRLG